MIGDLNPKKEMERMGTNGYFNDILIIRLKKIPLTSEQRRNVVARD